jgi:serine/threonine protein kinase
MAAADSYADDFEAETAGSGSATGAAATSASSGTTPTPGFEDVDISEVEIGKKLGGGGFAVVFHARWREKRVAAKVLVDPKISDALRKEFMDELHVMR